MKLKPLSLGALMALMSLTQSCQKDDVVVAPATTTAEIDQLQRAFAKTLAKAVQADPDLRGFLKQEALKRFDKDYDVLYQMIKDIEVKGATIHDRLAKYAATPGELAQVEQKVPLLTVLIPTLPSGFSPETWDAASQIPQVAVREIQGTNKIPLYGADGQEQQVEPRMIPGFPVLVVKQNERVIAANRGSKKTGTAFYESNSFSFQFSAPAFDGVQSNTASRVYVVDSSNEPMVGPPISTRVIQAYQIGTTNPNLWQRDYVYYGISPTNPSGPLKTNFRETIRSFKLSVAGINRIVGNAGDPAQPVNGTPNPGTPGTAWMDGDFEFKAAVLYNAKDGSGDQTNALFGARPQELYNVTYTSFGPVPFNWYVITSVTPIEFHPNIPIAAWDLKNFGTAWKYHIYEENSTVEVTTKSTVSSQYSGNFEINTSGGFGEVWKVGAKFGASTTSTETKEVTLKYTQGSTELGEKVSYFYDPIVLTRQYFGSGGIIEYSTYELAPGGSAGFVFLSVEPYSIVPSEN